LPELPEAETVRSDLARVYQGDRLARISVTGRRTVRRHRPELLRTLEGLTLTGVGRHGKYLLLQWEGGPVMVAHLRMSGQLLSAQAGDPVALHTHAVLRFAHAGELRFVDPRTFGELFIAAPGPGLGSGPAPVANAAPGRGGGGPNLTGLAHLGPDALSIGAPDLHAALAGRRAPLKALLVDQRVLAGVGNIYADEICFEARLRPHRAAGSLARAEVTRLAASTRSVLAAAIVARGSTLADNGYQDLSGRPGSFQLQHQVYARAGLPCGRCGRPVQRIIFGARRAYFCPHCQR
jgi:formamidopyrimidine-DNA glycosylase